MCPVIHAPGTKASTACKNEESLVESTTSVDRTNALWEMMSLTVLKWCRRTYNSKVATVSSKWYLETRQNNGVWSRFFGWERYKWKIFLAEWLLAVAVWCSVLKTSYSDAGQDLSSCPPHLSVVMSCLCLSPANAPACCSCSPSETLSERLATGHSILCAQRTCLLRPKASYQDLSFSRWAAHHSLDFLQGLCPLLRPTMHGYLKTPTKHIILQVKTDHASFGRK